MINFRVDPQLLAQIQQGDVRVLRQVLEAESAKAKTVLVEQAVTDSFRFQQGFIQSLDAVMKLLP